MEFRIGDVTAPPGHGTKIIAHICNNARQWRDPVSLAISQRWAEPEQSFYRQGNLLGTIKVVTVEQDVLVANLFAQEGPDPGELPRETLEICLKTVAHFADMYAASVHLARAPGILQREWEQAADLIAGTLDQIELYVYDRP